MQINKLVKDIRLMMGKTQRELAEELFVSQNTLSQYERGERNVPNEFLESLLEKVDMELKVEKKYTKEKADAIDRLMAINKKANKLKEKFPTWHIEDSGGGVLLLEKKVFSKQQKEPVLVVISSDTAMIIKEKDLENGGIMVATDETLEKYIDRVGYDEYIDGYENQLPLFSLGKELELILTEVAKEMFEEDVLMDFEYISKEIEKVELGL